VKNVCTASTVGEQKGKKHEAKLKCLLILDQRGEEKVCGAFKKRQHQRRFCEWHSRYTFPLEKTLKLTRVAAARYANIFNPFHNGLFGKESSGGRITQVKMFSQTI
jgi:hypothetical protein